MTRQMNSRIELTTNSAFTLFELVVVLAIISALAAMVVPFSRRSNEALKVRQHSSSIAQMLRYALSLAENSNSVRFVFDSKSMSYSLEAADDTGNFRRSEDFVGQKRFLDNNIYLSDIDGFDQAGREYFLAFDWRLPWPQAHISLSTKDVTETIRINARSVEVEEQSL
jgi:prepilin-type N-terminal cleavage/methylation domain-containing protein